VRIEYDDNGIALGEWHWDPEEGEWIYVEYAPVKTGDSAQTALYIALGSASLLSLALLLIGKRRRRRRKDAPRQDAPNGPDTQGRP
jgi:LPXTG-motif cell wall-anchored protein